MRIQCLNYHYEYTSPRQLYYVGETILQIAIICDSFAVILMM